MHHLQRLNHLQGAWKKKKKTLYRRYEFMKCAFMLVKLIRMTQDSIKPHGLHRGDPHLQRATLSIIKFSCILNVSRKMLTLSHINLSLYIKSKGRACFLAATTVLPCLYNAWSSRSTGYQTKFFWHHPTSTISV